MTLSGKVAIVTGASRGIGEAIAATLAAQGVTLALIARASDDLSGVAARLSAGQGQRAVAFPCDLRRNDTILAMVDAVMREFGRIDVVVNNAGATPHGNLLDLADAQWLEAYDAKIHAFVRVTRACWPHLKTSKGRVVNIGGVLAHTPNPNALIGSTLAAAVVALTKALAEQGRTDGITVSGVNPGLIETGRLRQNLEAHGRKNNQSLETERVRVLQQVGIDRLGTAQDVADVVAFLLSDAITYLQGVMIDVDGGMTKSV
jgi:NAD(P)-dependent dehydrogenase (short-subunit alcohol dehydrogenase family)